MLEKSARMIGGVTEARSSKADLPTNSVLAAQFDLLADLMELEGSDAFRIGAYRKAAARIRETGSSVAQLALAGRAKELQGIGKTIEEKIVQAVEDGEVHALTKRKAEVPQEVASFMRLPGLGPKTAATALARARDHHRRRAAGRRRGAAAARAGRAGREVGGEDPRRARPAAGRGGAAAGAARDGAAEAAGRRRDRWLRILPRSTSRSPARPAATARRCATST